MAATARCTICSSLTAQYHETTPGCASESLKKRSRFSYSVSSSNDFLIDPIHSVRPAKAKAYPEHKSQNEGVPSGGILQ